MPGLVDILAEQYPDLVALVVSQSGGADLYRDNPVAYATERLKLTLTQDQRTILQSLVTWPNKTLVKAGHEVGKSLVAAVAVCWWFDTRTPSIVLTTAPTYKQVKDVLWKEVRRLRINAGLPDQFPGPKVPRLEASADHFAVGLTASDSSAFQGQHGPNVLIVIDEAVGVAKEIWDVAHTMAHCFLAIYNPTDTTSAAYQEECQSERPYTQLVMSQLDHPNVRGWTPEAKDWPLAIPNAVKPWEVDINIRAWCQPIKAEDRKGTDIEWPCGSGQFWRPGPLAEARILGRWPSQGTYGVWSDADWQLADRPLPSARSFERAATDSLLPPAGVLPRIGLDVAVFGDDWTQFHVRCGRVSLKHDGYNGRDTDHTIGVAVQLADEYAAWATARLDTGSKPIERKDIVIVVDVGGIGGDLPVRMRAQGLTVYPVNAGTPAAKPHEFPNKRSELWFAAAERARMGQLVVSGLPTDVRRKLKAQAMQPKWKLDAAGRRVVEPKEKTKAESGRSPDDMDALNLAYYEHASTYPEKGVPNPEQHSLEKRYHGEQRRSLFGGR